MPALVIFGRRWRLGSDDLAIPVSGYILLHIPALIILTSSLIWTYYSYDDPEDPSSINATTLAPPLLSTPPSYITTLSEITSQENTTAATVNDTACVGLTQDYALAIDLVYLIELLLECAIVFTSCKGSIIDEKPRQHIYVYIYLRIVVGFLEGGLWAASFSLLFWSDRVLSLIDSPFTAKCTYLIAVIWLQLVVSTLSYAHTFFLLFWSFDSSGRDSEYDLEKATQIWNRRLKLCFCCVNIPQLEIEDYEYIPVPRSQSMTSAVYDPVNGEETADLQCEDDPFDEPPNARFMKNLRKEHGIHGRDSEGGKLDVLQAVAKMWTVFFKDVNLVATDILVALLLYRQQQKLEKNAKRFSLRWTLSTAKFVQHSIQEDFMRYLQYCNAIYGEMLYILDSVVMSSQTYPERMRSLKRLNPKKHMGPNAPDTNVTLKKSHEAFAITTALQKAGLMAWLKKFNLIDANDPKLEILQINQCNSLLESPYFIAHDTVRDEYIITIRGTLSLADALTDLMADVEYIFTSDERRKIPRQFREFRAHQGMVHSIRTIYAAMDELVSGLPRSAKIRVTGHSLGAGCAAILTIYLKVAKEFTNVRGYCFAPPGGLLNDSAMRYSKTCITSLSFGKDIIPRIGMPQLENLMNQVVEVLAKCDENKWSVLFMRATGLKGGHKPVDSTVKSTVLLCPDDATSVSSMSRVTNVHDSWREHVQNQLSGSRLSEAASASQESLDLTAQESDEDSLSLDMDNLQVPLANRSRTLTFSSSTAEERKRLFLPTAPSHVIETGEPMYPPGSMYHISHEYELGKVKTGFYDEILLSPRMMLDHLPNRLLHALTCQRRMEIVRKLNIHKRPTRITHPFTVKPGNKVTGRLFLADAPVPVTFSFTVLDPAYMPDAVSHVDTKSPPDTTQSPPPTPSNGPHRGTSKHKTSWRQPSKAAVPIHYSPGLNVAVQKMDWGTSATFMAPTTWLQGAVETESQYQSCSAEDRRSHTILESNTSISHVQVLDTTLSIADQEHITFRVELNEKISKE